MTKYFIITQQHSFEIVNETTTQTVDYPSSYIAIDKKQQQHTVNIPAINYHPKAPADNDLFGKRILIAASRQSRHGCMARSLGRACLPDCLPECLYHCTNSRKHRNFNIWCCDGGLILLFHSYRLQSLPSDLHLAL